MTSVLKETEEERDTHIEEKPHEGKHRDWRDVTTSQGMPGAPDAGGGRKDPPTEPAERAQLCHLDLTLFQTLGF